MRTTIAVSALALLVAAAPSSANAADVYSSAKDPVVYANTGPVNWTGFYLGVNGGYGQFESSRDTILDGHIVPSSTLTVNGSVPVSGAEPSGFMFGGQFGYLYQPTGSNFVFGGEFAFDGSNITGDVAGVNTGTAIFTTPLGSITRTGAVNTSMHQELDYVGALTGVVGLTLGNAMVYTKAGLAFGKVQEDVGFSFPGSSNSALALSRNEIDTGWTAGAGVAYKFTPNWSFGIEFNYFDLGSHSLNYIDTAVYGNPKAPLKLTTNSISEDFWDVKGVINYQVGGSVYQSLK